MDSTTRILLAVALVAIFAKLMLGGKADKSADIPGLLKKGALLIDTRTPGEFSHGHIKGAINIPHNTISEQIGKHSPDKSKSIIVYCRSGTRSSIAKQSLIRAGYTHVINGGSQHRMHKILGQ